MKDAEFEAIKHMLEHTFKRGGSKIEFNKEELSVLLYKIQQLESLNENLTKRYKFALSEIDVLRAEIENHVKSSIGDLERKAFRAGQSSFRSIGIDENYELQIEFDPQTFDEWKKD